MIAYVHHTAPYAPFISPACPLSIVTNDSPGSKLVYAGATGALNAAPLAGLGVAIASHAQMPDVVLYHAATKNRLLLIESATSHGPIDEARRAGHASLFTGSTAGLVYVTAFPNRATMARYLGDVAWETEVCVADAPAHLIHFDGQRRLGPYSPR